MKKTELIDRIRTGREQLEAALERVPPGQREQPGLPGGWTMGDLLAHIEFWEDRATYLLTTLMAGRTPKKLAGGSVDEVNAEIYSKNRGLPYETLREREQHAYQALLAAVEEASEEDLTDPLRFAWTKGQPFYEWIAGNSWEHYAEHIENIDQWLGSGTAR